MNMKKAIVSSLPDCDICRNKGNKVEAQYDAKLNIGVWGYLCEEHFIKYGIGLGEGKGQKLIVEELEEITKH